VVAPHRSARAQRAGRAGRARRHRGRKDELTEAAIGRRRVLIVGNREFTALGEQHLQLIEQRIGGNPGGSSVASSNSPSARKAAGRDRATTTSREAATAESRIAPDRRSRSVMDATKSKIARRSSRVVHGVNGNSEGRTSTPTDRKSCTRDSRRSPVPLVEPLEHEVARRLKGRDDKEQSASASSPSSDACRSR